MSEINSTICCIGFKIIFSQPLLQKIANPMFSKFFSIFANPKFLEETTEVSLIRIYLPEKNYKVMSTSFNNGITT